MTDVAARLGELRDRGLYRRLRLIEGAQGPRVTLDGRSVLLLCSNNYLGLADEPRVREAAAEAALRWGAGAGASRLISGNMEAHRSLEAGLAEFAGYDAALLFGSGYLANTGAIAALAGAGEVVFSDALNHASIIDGCRLSRAETFVYRHADLDHLEWGLREAGGRGSLIVSDGVFSMDGDVAPLAGLLELARRHGARLMVDDAHAIGAIGPGGRGSVAAAGLSGEVDVVVGTLGKALGSYGAYVCATPETTDYLLNTARPFIFSTAPPPPAVGAAAAALELLDRRARAGRPPAGQRGDPARRRLPRRAWRRLLAPRSSRSRSARPSRRWGSASGCSSVASSPRESGRRPSPPAPAACADRDGDPPGRGAGRGREGDRRRRPRDRPRPSDRLMAEGA